MSLNRPFGVMSETDGPIRFIGLISNLGFVSAVKAMKPL
jgi:hypothetical protein